MLMFAVASVPIIQILLVRPWLRPAMAGIRVRSVEVASLPVRGVRTSRVVDACIELKHSGTLVSFQRLVTL